MDGEEQKRWRVTVQEKTLWHFEVSADDPFEAEEIALMDFEHGLGTLGETYVSAQEAATEEIVP